MKRSKNPLRPYHRPFLRGALEAVASREAAHHHCINLRPRGYKCGFADGVDQTRRHLRNHFRVGKTAMRLWSTRGPKQHRARLTQNLEHGVPEFGKVAVAWRTIGLKVRIRGRSATEIIAEV